MSSVGIARVDYIHRRIRLCDYLCVAELYLQKNFLLEKPLEASDIKPRLLGHWGTCHGINVAYANCRAFFDKDPGFSFILGPGHGFPALNANLFIDGELSKVSPRARLDAEGIAYLCREFSWPDGFPSHASPITPGVITEGGELGYALANAYGVSLGHPEKTIAVLIGDGELETATAIDSLNLPSLIGGKENGHVLPILHLNGYKISAPTLYARRSERELNQMIRGFGYTPIGVGEDVEEFQSALARGVELLKAGEHPFYVLKTEKGEGGPNRGHESHQIPLKNPASDADELVELQRWLESYRFNELFSKKKGFKL